MNSTSLQTASAYYQANPGTRWLRWALGLSERVWPALAVRGAYRVFGTPLPSKWLHRRQPGLARWRLPRLPFAGASLTLDPPPPGPDRWCCCCTAGVATPSRCCRWRRP